ncbi:MAG: hypothetical protein R3F11_27555 [Verrucomicrobiales bacterium]
MLRFAPGGAGGVGFSPQDANSSEIPAQSAAAAMASRGRGRRDRGGEEAGGIDSMRG